jgi:hypothetical protein
MGRNANVRLNAHLRRCPTVNRTGPVRIPLRKRPSADRHLGNVAGGAHREFAMASGEMSDAEFLAFNIAWIEAATAQLVEGGVFGTFIDWRGLPARQLYGSAVERRSPAISARACPEAGWRGTSPCS